VTSASNSGSNCRSQAREVKQFVWHCKECLKWLGQVKIVRLTVLNSLTFVYFHVIECLYTGFELVIGFIEHLQIVTTSNYSTIANSHSTIHNSTY
jgi:hypothetical protein